jgi:hypothetical protein
MLFGFSLRSAAAIGLVMTLSSATFSGTPVTEAGVCAVNATVWTVPNNGRTTTSMSPVGVPGTRTDFTMGADGCAVAQVTAYANAGGQLFLYFVLDGVVGPSQRFSELSEGQEVVTTTEILKNLSAGPHRLSLRVSSNGDPASITPLNITVHYRK